MRKQACCTIIALAASMFTFSGCGTAPVDNGGGGGTGAVDIFNVYYDTDGLANNVINDLAVDYFRSGLWVATQKGVSFFSFKDSTWTTYDTASGLPNLKVTSIAVNLGTVWAGTKSGPASLEGSTWNELPDPGVLPDTFVTVIASMPEPDFSLWFGTHLGLARRSATGEWTSFTDQGGITFNNVTSIARDSGGKIWVGTLYGLNIYDGARWSAYTTSLPSAAVNAVYADSFGSMWIGTSSGMAEFKGSQQVRFGTADGLPSPIVNDFVEDFNGVLWSGTGSGPAWFDGKGWTKLALPTQVEGLQVTSLASDALTKSLWIGTVSGLARYRAVVK
jgi:ligand-binding sensor domain-containing protein